MRQVPRHALQKWQNLLEQSLKDLWNKPYEEAVVSIQHVLQEVQWYQSRQSDQRLYEEITVSLITGNTASTASLYQEAINRNLLDLAVIAFNRFRGDYIGSPRFSPEGEYIRPSPVRSHLKEGEADD